MICPSCGWTNNRTKEQKSKAIKAAIKRARLSGKTIGRPKVADIDEIRFFRRKGLSLNEIAFKLGISRPTVVRALKTGYPPVEK